MRIGLRVSPAWVSTGGSRRRRRKVSVGKTVAMLVPLVVVGDALAEGGLWAALGWTAVAATLIVLIVRAVRHAPGVQHAGIDRHEPVFEPPVSERLAYSSRP